MESWQNSHDILLSKRERRNMKGHVHCDYNHAKYAY